MPSRLGPMLPPPTSGDCAHLVLGRDTAGYCRNSTGPSLAALAQGPVNEIPLLPLCRCSPRRTDRILTVPCCVHAARSIPRHSLAHSVDGEEHWPASFGNLEALYHCLSLSSRQCMNAWFRVKYYASSSAPYLQLRLGFEPLQAHQRSGAMSASLNAVLSRMIGGRGWELSLSNLSIEKRKITLKTKSERWDAHGRRSDWHGRDA